MSTTLDHAILDVITYLVSSAPNSLEETPILAAFRMLDAADRLMAVIEENPALAMTRSWPPQRRTTPITSI